MSTATALHHLGSGTTLARRPARQRQRLRPAGPDGIAEGVPGSQSEPLRITRRGRLAITLTVAATLAVVGIAMTSMLATGATGPAETVRVQSGQTLSQIAERHLPELDLREAVVQIQLANDMSSLHVHAGQELVIPVP